MVTINTNRIRYSFACYGNAAVRQVDYKFGIFYNKSTTILKNFFEFYFWDLMTSQMIRKTRYFNKLINFMQKRMRDKCVTGDAKFQIVDRHWNNMLFKWYKIAKAH